MTNNYHLSSWNTQFDEFYQANPETHLNKLQNQSTIKEKQLFLKSQVSLADTTCDQNSPISHMLEDHSNEEPSFSLTEFNLDDSHCSTGDDGVCNEYTEKGFCMRGVECTKMHIGIEEYKMQSQKKSSLLLPLFISVPELLISCRRPRERYF